MSKQKFYLTTPIYYVNARPHIGHAYTTIAADVIARRHRLLGDDTFFLTGTDEHGQKIERSAAASGIPPQQFADQVSQSFRDLWDRMGITYDDYIRTTEPRHTQAVQKLFQLLCDRDAIYLSTYTGQYSIGEEMFVDGPPGTIGPDGKPTETVTEENYFFRLSDYQERLINLIESNELSIQPEVRKNEVLSFLRGNIAGVDTNRVPHLRDGLIVDKVGGAPQTSSETPEPGVPPSNPESPDAPPLDSQTWVKSPGAPSMPKSHLGMGGSEEPSPASPNPATPSPTDTPSNAVILTLSLPKGKEEPTSKTLAYSKLGTPYLPGALKDLSISRTSFKWGIPVPNNEKHVIYVWLDALANYMTAIGYGSDDPAEQEKFNHYWPADLHLVGKEIIRFHCVYWPAFLLAANLPLPKAITAHGWLLFEDSKMSKSRGNIVRTETILDAFGPLCPKPTASEDGFAGSFGGSRGLQPPESTPTEAGALAPGLSDQAWKHEQDLFAADVLRYFLLREIPFGQDGSFSFDALVQRYNSDLANGYGNLVSRTLKMIADFRSHSTPDKSRPHSFVRLFESLLTTTNNPLESPMDQYDFSRYLEVTWGLIAATDNQISLKTPWKLAKNDDSESQKQLDEVLYSAAESIRIITALLHPIMPHATAKVWTQLGLGDIEAAAENGELKDLKWGDLKPGTRLGPLSPIFPRADKGLIQIMTDMESPATPPTPSKLVDEKTTHTSPVPEDPTHPGAAPRTSALHEPNPGAQVGAAAAPGPDLIRTPPHAEAPASGPFASSAAASTTPDTPQIAIDDFVKIDLRVAKIIVAERIPKADKLLRLEVDLGYETRQILSGIAEWYTPEELIGRKIVVIANLAPRKMRGLESHGMLLAASHGENGKPILATFGEDIALGSRLR